MAGMSIVHGSPQTIWVPIVPATTIYVGGIVCITSAAPEEGVVMLPDESGVLGAGNHNVPFGICIGTNRKNPLFNSTELTEYITSPAADDAHDGASIDYVGVEGPWAKTDPIAMVKIAVIVPGTVIRAPIRNAAIKTAPTVATVTSLTTGGGTGVGCTVDGIDHTALASNLDTIYFRTGGNAGTYRTLDSAHATALTWDMALKSDVTIGDTCVVVPIRTHGYSTVMFDATTAMFIDNADDAVLLGTARWTIQVLRLDLSVAGNEYCEFVFDPGHFCHYAVA